MPLDECMLLTRAARGRAGGAARLVHQLGAHRREASERLAEGDGACGGLGKAGRAGAGRAYQECGERHEAQHDRGWLPSWAHRSKWLPHWAVQIVFKSLRIGAARRSSRDALGDAAERAVVSTHEITVRTLNCDRSRIGEVADKHSPCARMHA